MTGKRLEVEIASALWIIILIALAAGAGWGIVAAVWMAFR